MNITTIPASELRPGDVISYSSWAVRVIEAELTATGKMVRTRFTYERCEFDPNRVGKTWWHHFRPTTLLPIANRKPKKTKTS